MLTPASLAASASVLGDVLKSGNCLISELSDSIERVTAFAGLSEA